MIILRPFQGRRSRPTRIPVVMPRLPPATVSHRYAVAERKKIPIAKSDVNLNFLTAQL